MAKKVVKKRQVKRKTNRRKLSVLDTKKKKLFFSIGIAICLCLAIFLTLRNCFGDMESFDSDKYFVKGIDVSHHNPILNWDMVMQQNITFAYMKATEGTTHQDRNYIYNYDLAKKANVKVGSYHFYTFAQSGKDQANFFLKTARFASGDLLPAIDVEHSPANPYSKDKKYVDMVVNELKVMENELYEHFGVHPVIYTNQDCYKLYIKEYFPENIIWLCDLQKEPSDKIKNWRIWQFTHKGELPGMEGHVDLNYYRYSFNEFKELLLP